MYRPAAVILIALTALALTDIAACHAAGLTFTHWGYVVPATLAIAAVGAFYHCTRRSARIAQMALWVVSWIAFSIVGAILTYAAAAHGGPLRDATYAVLDHSLGFDWTAWFDFVNRHNALKFVLGLVYTSLTAQILLSVFLFAYRGWDERNGELLLGVIVALVIATTLFRLFPALGPCAGIPAFQTLYIGDLVGLREGSLTSFDLTQLKGVIAFPSFHAVLAVLFTYSHRGWCGFPLVAGFNTAMLATIPSEGGHYLFDVLAGLAIAGAAILLVRMARPRWLLACGAAPAGA